MNARRTQRMNLFSFQDIIMSVMGILLLITLLLALFLVTPSKANLSNQEAIKELETDLANAMNEETTLQARAMSLSSTLVLLRDRPDTNRITSELSRIREGIIAKSNSLEEVNQQIADLKASRAEQVVKLGLNYLMQETEQIKEQAKQAEEANTKDQALIREQKQRVKEAQESLVTLRKEANKLWVIPSSQGTGKEPLLVTVSGEGIELNRFNRPEEKKTFPKSSAVTELKAELAGMKTTKDYILFFIRPSGVTLYRECRSEVDASSFKVGFDAVEEKAELIFTRNLE